MRMREYEPERTEDDSVDLVDKLDHGGTAGSGLVQLVLRGVETASRRASGGDTWPELGVPTGDRRGDCGVFDVSLESIVTRRADTVVARSGGVRL